MLRVMLAALLLGVGVVAAPLTASANDGDYLDVDITAISTPTLDLGDREQVIDISGTVTNTSTVSVRYAAVHFWRSPQPLASPAALAEHLADPPAGQRLFQEPNVDILSQEEGLAPGERATFTVRGTVEELVTQGTPLTVTNVAYALGVQVLGNAPGENRRVVGRDAIGVAAATEPVESSALVLLTAPPTWLPSGEFLSDGLAEDLDDRLETLLASAERPGVLAAIDPAVYAAVARLTEEHVVDGEPVDGNGIALAWLKRVDALAAQGRLLRLPAGNPDLARADASGILAGVLGWSDDAVPAVLAKLPTVAVLGAGATPELAARLGAVNTVIVRGAAGGDGGTPRVLAGAQPTEQGLPDGVRLARRIADELVAPSPPLYLIENAQDVRADQHLDPWRRHVDPSAPVRERLSWPETRPATPWRKVAAALEREAGQASILYDLTGEPSPGLSELGATAFSAGFANEKAALTYLSAAAKPSTDLAKVKLRAVASFVMGSSTNTFPATLTNELDVPVTVGVRFTSDAPQRVRVPDLAPMVLPPGEPVTVNITPEADANGVALVEAQVVTRGGVPVGKATTIEITATNFGSIGWLIIAGSGAVVLGGTAWRIRAVRREQAKMDATGNEEGE